MRYTAVIIAILALVVACAPQAEQPEPTQQDLPPEPTIPAEDTQQDQQQPEDNIEPAETALDDIFGPVNNEEVITVDDVSCDLENKRLTFRFRNLDDVSWQLNQEVPFPAPSGLASVRVIFNQFEVNGNQQYFVREGEGTYFGPNETFSENCQGTHTLEPGQTTTCTLYPVPFVEHTNVADNNEIFINGPGQDGRVRFSCTA